jgi:hypothetical protein
MLVAQVVYQRERWGVDRVADPVTVVRQPQALRYVGLLGHLNNGE